MPLAFFAINFNELVVLSATILSDRLTWRIGRLNPRVDFDRITVIYKRFFFIYRDSSSF